mgnify:CR=1 FL=1
MPEFETTTKPYLGDFFQFKCGTCEGLWRSTPTHYEILAVKNKQKHNGHFKILMRYFEQSCRRDNKKLLISECWNPRLMWMNWKNGFKRVSLFNWEKTF